MSGIIGYKKGGGHMPLSDMQYRDLLRRIRDDYEYILSLTKDGKADEINAFLSREIKRISQTLEDK